MKARVGCRKTWTLSKMTYITQSPNSTKWKKLQANSCTTGQAVAPRASADPMTKMTTILETSIMGTLIQSIAPIENLSK